MGDVAWILLLGAFLFGGTFGAFVMVVIGIHSGNRHRNLAGPARNPAESASKRLLTATRNTRPGNSDSQEH
jgi:hypothetical protein